MYTNKKPIIMAVLCALIVVMAIGFALLSQNLTITGTSHIDSNWNIRITNIRVKSLNSAYQSGTNASADVSGSTGCTTQTAPCDSTTANFEAKLITPGDYITYEVTVTNSGNLDAEVSGITLTPESGANDPIQVSKSGLQVGDKLGHTSGSNTNTIDVTVTYNSATSTQPVSTTTNITLQINYQQDLSASQGGSGNGGSSVVGFDKTTGTGIIYRYLNSDDENVVETQLLEDNQSIEEYINNENNNWEWSTDPSTFNSIVYLKHEVENYILNSSYACFLIDGEEHCLRGNMDDYEGVRDPYYDYNVGVLQEVQGWFKDPNRGGSCSIDTSPESSTNYSFCSWWDNSVTSGGLSVGFYDYYADAHDNYRTESRFDGITCRANGWSACVDYYQAGNY